MGSSRPPLSESSRSEEHTSELQSPGDLVCRLLLEKKKKKKDNRNRVRRGTQQWWRQKTQLPRLDVRFRVMTISCFVTSVFSYFFFFFFFLNNRAPPKFSPFPLPAPFPI